MLTTKVVILGLKKDKIDYKVIGRLSDDMLDKLIKLIIKLNLKNKTKDLINNL